MKTYRAGILVPLNGGELFDNRVRDDEMEEIKVLASTLPATRIFSIERLEQVVKRYAAGIPSEVRLHRNLTNVGRW